MTAALAHRTVGVIGSGREPHLALSEPLGRLLARLGVNLMTGGGGGVMDAVARAYVAARPERGISIGILPASAADVPHPPPGYPNPNVQLAIATHLHDRGHDGDAPMSRNHVIVLSADAIVALPGSFGTESEVRLALAYGRPIAIYSPDAEATERMSSSAPRVATLGAVEEFLRRALNIGDETDG